MLTDSLRHSPVPRPSTIQVSITDQHHEVSRLTDMSQRNNEAGYTQRLAFLDNFDVQQADWMRASDLLLLLEQWIFVGGITGSPAAQRSEGGHDRGLRQCQHEVCRVADTIGLRG